MKIRVLREIPYNHLCLSTKNVRTIPASKQEAKESFRTNRKINLESSLVMKLEFLKD